MLTEIRERASGWVAWVIVVLISIPFALWGIQSYFEGSNEVTVATVNGEEISFYDFQEQFSRERRERAEQAGGNFNASLFNSDYMRNQVLERMVSNRLALQYVRDSNYRLSDKRLKERIQSTPVFMNDEKFDAGLYYDILRANGFTPQSYEETERENAAIGQLASALSDSAFVTEQEVDHLLALQAQTRKTDYVLLTADRFESEISIDAEEAEQHYQSNQSAYEAPARIKVDYIELSVDGLASKITPTEEEISQVYEQTSGRYNQAEVRKASHILFSVEADAEESEREKILSKTESVLAKARDGDDFAKLAKKHSDDPGSKENGGDLGVVTKGQMVPPFEEAVFDMKQDEIRGPIETQFGYHIIKLTELTEERQKSLKEAREQVVEDAKRIQAEALFAEQSEAFQNLVFEDPDSLITASEDLELEIKQTDWFTKSSGEGVANEEQVRSAAFSEEVLNDDLNSPTIELGFDRFVALRKNEYEAARVKSFDEVVKEVEQKLKSDKSTQQTRELGAKLLAELSSGSTTWKKLLADQKLKSKELAESRDEVPADLAKLRDSVFAQARPDAGKIAYNGVSLSNGDYALYALKEIKQGDITKVDEEQRDELREQLLARDGISFYSKLLHTLASEADISFNREQLNNQANTQQY